MQREGTCSDGQKSGTTSQMTSFVPVHGSKRKILHTRAYPVLALPSRVPRCTRVDPTHRFCSKAKLIQTTCHRTHFESLATRIPSEVWTLTHRLRALAEQCVDQQCWLRLALHAAVLPAGLQDDLCIATACAAVHTISAGDAALGLQLTMFRPAHLISSSWVFR